LVAGETYPVQSLEDEYLAVDAETLDSAVADGGADSNLLHNIRKALPLLSDLSRSDLLLYVPISEEEALISDQARPHSIFPLYEEDLVGKRVDARAAPWVFRALASTRLRRGVQSGTVRDAPIVREVLGA
jgi:hypothetical protein